jgi:hypothetical protein
MIAQVPQAILDQVTKNLAMLDSIKGPVQRAQAWQSMLMANPQMYQVNLGHEPNLSHQRSVPKAMAAMRRVLGVQGRTSPRLGSHSPPSKKGSPSASKKSSPAESSTSPKASPRRPRKPVYKGSPVFNIDTDAGFKAAKDAFSYIPGVTSKISRQALKKKLNDMGFVV